MERAALIEIPRWKSVDEAKRARKDERCRHSAKLAKKRPGARRAVSSAAAGAWLQRHVPSVTRRLSSVITAPTTSPIAAYRAQWSFGSTPAARCRKYNKKDK